MSMAPMLFHRNDGMVTPISFIELLSVFIFEALCSRVMPNVCSLMLLL